MREVTNLAKGDNSIAPLCKICYFPLLHWWRDEKINLGFSFFFGVRNFRTFTVYQYLHFLWYSFINLYNFAPVHNFLKLNFSECSSTTRRRIVDSGGNGDRRWYDYHRYHVYRLPNCKMPEGNQSGEYRTKKRKNYTPINIFIFGNYPNIVVLPHSIVPKDADAMANSQDHDQTAFFPSASLGYITLW